MSEANTEVTQEEATQERTIYDVLNDIPGAPTKVQIEKWKAQYGDIFVSGFSDEEVFVWRPIRRKEYAKLQQLAADPKNEIDQLKHEELVCETCVLYPEAPFDWDKKAGTASTLAEQIFQNSHFVSAGAASLLVVKL